MKQGLSLTDIARVHARAATHEIGCSPDGAAVSHCEWVRQVLAWRATFQRVEGAEVGLYFEDPLAFSAALWGAWHAGKTPVRGSEIKVEGVAR